MRNGRSSGADFSAHLNREVKGLRIGVARHWHETDNPVSPAVQKRIENAIRIWRDQGAEIVELVMPSLFEYQAVNVVILTSEAFSVHETWMRAEINDYGELLRDRITMGALITSADYMQALRRRHELCAITAKSAADVDVLVTAGASAEAPRMDNVPKWGGLSSPGFTKPFNITGWPAICVCSGYGERGLPVAVQIAAKPFQEGLLFQVADAFEKAADFRARRPILAAAPADISNGPAKVGLAVS